MSQCIIIPVPIKKLKKIKSAGKTQELSLSFEIDFMKALKTMSLHSQANFYVNL